MPNGEEFGLNRKLNDSITDGKAGEH